MSDETPDNGTEPGTVRTTGGQRFLRAFDDKSRGLDRFGLVLILAIVSVIGLSLVDIDGPIPPRSKSFGGLIAVVLVGATLMMALRASGLSLRRQKLIDVLVLLVVLGYGAGVLLEVLGDRPTRPAGLSGAIVVLSIIAPVVIVLRLLRHRRVTAATMMGAISAYLLIGLAYFWVFLTVDDWQGGFFGETVGSTDFMYFSLTTLTTVGYGDLTAQTNLGHLVANSEAVVGQVYLVTFVAMIVGLRVAEWQADANERRRAAQQPPEQP